MLINWVNSIFYGFTKYHQIIYSQEGEDILLQRIMGTRKRNGFYVDIGAHHPARYSNTLYFYKQGWRGINIDATPGSMAVFRHSRRRDINLEMAVSGKKEILEFCIFNEPALNSADPQVVQHRLSNLKDTHSKLVTVQADTLEAILDKYLPSNQSIDFLSVDIEGHDLKALQSNNWKKYRPNYILVEIFDENCASVYNSGIGLFLQEVGYEPLSRLLHTFIFINNDLPKIKHL